MGELINWTAVSNGIAVIAIIIAILSYKAANRSADAAEKSTKAAEKSAEESIKITKVNKFSALSPHFNNIEHIIKAFHGYELTKGSKINSAEESIKHLRNAFPEDTDFQSILLELLTASRAQAVQQIAAMHNGTHPSANLGPHMPPNLVEIENIFNQRKKEHLAI